ncbi:hypothetical protein IFM89_024651 [Coptis chinensis]|uniref:Complex 1 LYR protein domain-containing protein n=1 Tax=Coptis chinensis TaxID=261450 RepID=A0A835J1X7_9MAGN|nr:hypothetical protein IFM89_022783 [Coptis chinensis]KAF9625618.1 hypothetical protein IFM89_024651 [Coptis chinensis]
MKRLTGLQKQVLALYRGFLRAATAIAPEEWKIIEVIVSEEFHRNANKVDRKNFIYIEYLLHRGFKQLDQLKSPDTISIYTLPVPSPPSKP